MTKWIERYRRQAHVVANERLEVLVLAELRGDELPTKQTGAEQIRTRSSVMSATSNRYQVSIEADPTWPIIRMTRGLRRHPGTADAGPHRSRAVRPLGWGPNGMQTKIVDRDATTGGRFCATSPGATARSTASTGRFHDVGEDRIVQTFTFDGQPDGVALETLWFEDLGDGRTPAPCRVARRQLRGPRPVARQRHGNRRTTRKVYGKLDALIAEFLMGNPADEHRRIAGAFTATVDSTAPAAWENPAPPEGWAARHVVRHLVEWFPVSSRGRLGSHCPRVHRADDDPVGAWRIQTDAVQVLLDDPVSAEREIDLPHLGTHAAWASHRHDLHRRRVPRPLGPRPGHRPGLDARPGQVRRDARGHAADGRGAAPERPRRPRVNVPDDADVQTKLLAFIGRTP